MNLGNQEPVAESIENFQNVCRFFFSTLNFLTFSQFAIKGIELQKSVGHQHSVFIRILKVIKLDAKILRPNCQSFYHKTSQTLLMMFFAN